MAFPNQNVRRSELKALPMRISQLQFDRLAALRERDGISMQEHVRRAIDAYLPKQERSMPPPANGDEPPVDNAAVAGKAGKPKVVRR